MRIYERIRGKFQDYKTYLRDLLSLVSYLLLLYTTEWSPDVPNTCGLRPSGNNPYHVTWISQGVYLNFSQYLVNVLFLLVNKLLSVRWKRFVLSDVRSTQAIQNI